jgi:hypothetical protein
MDRSHGTTEQRLERLERLNGETEERLERIERYLGIIVQDPVLGTEQRPFIDDGDEHQGSRKVKPKPDDGRTWRWMDW